MEEIQKRQRQAHEKIILRTIILGIVIGGILGGSILIMVPAEPIESLTIQEGGEFTDTLVNSVETYPAIGSTNTTILSVMDFCQLPVRVFEGSGAIMNIEHKEEGFIVSGQDYHLAFELYYHTLVYDFNTVDISLDCSAMEGFTVVRFLLDLPHYNRLSWTEEFVLNNASETPLVSSPELDRISFYSEYWLLETWLRIEIHSEGYSEVEISGLDVVAESDEPLYPMRVSFLDQAGIDISSNVHSPRHRRQPILNITNQPNPVPSSNGTKLDTDDRSNIITGRANLGTVFLPTGNYTFEYGWTPTEEFEALGSIDVEIQSDIGTNMTISLETIRVFITVPEGISTYVQLNDPEHNSFLYTFYDRVLDEVVYTHFPADTEELVLFFSLAGSYRTFSDTVSIPIESNVDIIIDIEFPLYRFLGFGLDTGQLLLTLIVFSAILSAAVSLQRLLDYGPIRTLFKNRESAPLFLLLVSHFVPWSMTSYTQINGTKVSQIVESFNPVSGLYLNGGSDRLFVYTPSEVYNTSMMGILFGVMITLILVRMFTGYYSETTPKMLLPYSITGLLSLSLVIDPIPFWYGPSLGPFLPILAFLIILYQHLSSEGTKAKPAW